MSLKKNLVRNSFYLLFDDISRTGMVFVTLSLSIRYFGLKDYGLYVLCMSILEITMVLPYNSDESFNRFLPEFLEKKDNNTASALYSFNLSIYLIFASVLTGLIYIFSTYLDFLRNENISSILVLVCFFPFARILSNFNTNLALGIQYVKNLTYFRVSLTISQLIIVLITMLLEINLEIFIFLNILILFIIEFIIQLVLFKQMKTIFNFEFNFNFKEISSRVFQYVTPLYGSKYSYTLHQHLSKVLVGIYLPIEFLTLFSAPKALIEKIAGFYYKIPGILIPNLVKYKSKYDLKYIVKEVIQMNGLFILLSLSLILLIQAIGYEILWLFGDDKLITAFPILLILSLHLMFRIPANYLATILYADDKTPFIFKVNLIKMIVEISLLFFLIKYLDIYGAAISILLGYFLSSFIIQKKVSKDYNEIEINWYFYSMIIIHTILMQFLFDLNVSYSTYLVIKVFLLFIFLFLSVKTDLIINNVHRNNIYSLIDITKSKIGFKK